MHKVIGLRKIILYSMLIALTAMALAVINYLLINPPMENINRETLNSATETEFVLKNGTVIANWTQIEEQYKTDCGGFPHPRYHVSPEKDNNIAWHIAYCIYPDTGLPYTRFIKRDKTLVWEVSFYEIYGSKRKDEFPPEGITDGGIGVVNWSNDGRYAYLEPWYCCVDGPGLLFTDVFALYRLDLAAGDVTEIFPRGGSLGFSNDGKYLAYSISPAQIHLRNLNTEKDVLVDVGVEFAQIGLFTWSPDNSKLVFVGAMEEWVCNTEGFCENEGTPYRSEDGFTLMMLDLESMEIINLIDNDTRLLRPDPQAVNPWIDNKNLLLIDGMGNKYIFDIAGKKLHPNNIDNSN